MGKHSETMPQNGLTIEAQAPAIESGQGPATPVELAAYFESILNTVADPLFVKDDRHRWVTFNDAFCKFMGHPREALIGKSDFDFLPESEASVFWEKDEEVLRSGQENINEELFTDAQGRRHVLSTKKALYVDAAGRKFIVAIIRDITEQKAREERIRELNGQLGRQLASLDAVNKELEAFSHTISHELRTPLTAIKGAASVLSGGKAGPVSDKQAKFLDIISNHSVRLNRLIDDLLDLSKMEAGKMTYHLAEGDLTALTQEIAQGFAQVFEDKGIDLVMDLSPVRATFDPDRISQVLSNLLTNASKFTMRGGRVVVRVQEHDGQAVLKVADDGIGILQEHQAQLFSKFYQVESSDTRKVGGTGLGLAICKSIVEEGHGGTIQVESQLGRGTTFIVRLPLHPA